MYFDFDKHLKSKRYVDVSKESQKSSEDQADDMNDAFLEQSEIYEDIHSTLSNEEFSEALYVGEDQLKDDKNSSQLYTTDLTKTIDEYEQALINSQFLTLHRFKNPPLKNLCFSNVVATCLLNIPVLRKFLKEESVDTKKRKSIRTELSQLSKLSSTKAISTQQLRAIVMSKCLESGQRNRNFDSNEQFDCVEFLQSLLEHFWKELPIPVTLNETVFGGLYQESFLCECGNKVKHEIQELPELISVSINGYTIQSCLDSHFSQEQIEKRCPMCPLLKCLKSVEIIVPPATLILQLNRFSYDRTSKTTNKLHTPVSCPVTLSLQGTAMYQLNSVINHMGENTRSGHYNILVMDEDKNSFIMVDDLEIRRNPVSSNMNNVSYVAVYIRQ